MIPITPFLFLYLAVFLTAVGLQFVLTRINIGYLRRCGDKIPHAFEEYIDGAKLTRIRDYTVQNQNLDILASSLSRIVFVMVILSGLLPWATNTIRGLDLGFLASGLIFFAVIGIAEGIWSLPFNYYQTFVIEQRFGYNTSTFGIWVTDVLKGAVVAFLLGAILLSLLLSLIEHGGRFWWLWAWFFFAGFQALLVIIFPTVIAPWFNKFIPLEDKVLEEKVKEVMTRSGLSVSGVFKMDASKRSRHSNAYFTGLGKAKRIVLFDTLLAAHPPEEIIAILAHEAGHWKRKHVYKNLLLTSSFSLILLYLTARLLTWEVLYQSFGFQHIVSYVGLFLVGVLWDAVNPFIAPIGCAISRRFEREADFYATWLLPQTVHLVSALKRLASDNLSNLHPHPLYAWFYYSHPPLLERISYLEDIAKET